MGCIYGRRIRNLLRRVRLLENGETGGGGGSLIVLPSTYHNAGSKTVAELTSSLLTEEHEGEVYNITDSGTTTSDFIEGQGILIEAGDNIGVVQVIDNEENIVYKFDLLSVHINTQDFVLKSLTLGLLKNDGTVDTNTYLTQHQDISGKVNASEMTITPGTGANADKTTIQLKSGTSATVLTQHLDISSLMASSSVRNVVVCTLNEYDALIANNQIDVNTEYNIIEE